MNRESATGRGHLMVAPLGAFLHAFLTYVTPKINSIRFRLPPAAALPLTSAPKAAGHYGIITKERVGNLKII